MKAQIFLIVIVTAFLFGCSGSHIDEGHLAGPTDEEIKTKGKGCTSEAITALNSMTEICSETLSNQTDKASCVEAAENFKADYPGVVCNLEAETIVTSTFIDEEILPAARNPQTEAERLTEMGFFDE